ncbi:MAG: hypothetical protein LBJ62_08520 [Bifidobacteriaceae bacterium]|nr:hypothetical protein [Bifidobacteriaceae bacterium]
MRHSVKTILLHLGMAGAVTGAWAAWHWQLRWGATPAEQRRVLPGDDVVPQPNCQSTRAIGISAPPSLVWPWIVQLGQDKAGFYSYDWSQRAAGLEITKGDAVKPEWQDLRAGDSVNLAEQLSLRVHLAEPERALVLERPSGDSFLPGVPPFEFSWAFILEPEGPTGTRLVVRERYVWLRWRDGLAVKAVAWVSFLMSRRMMLGVRERAERAWRDHLAVRLDDAAGESPQPVSSSVPSAPSHPEASPDKTPNPNGARSRTGKTARGTASSKPLKAPQD